VVLVSLQRMVGPGQMPLPDFLLRLTASCHPGAEFAAHLRQTQSKGLP